ncbi:MAG: LD-carboxypeptidase [Cyclobacteriaceae bacterium]
MIYPPKLNPGDTVGIVAPARKISPAQLEAALKTLKSWGLKTLLPKNIFSSKHSYLAGTDDERCEDVQNFIDNPEVKAIFSARGGYGSTRIIEEINFSPLVTNPKWIVGFSDVTAVHLRLLSLGIASIHGTMPIFFAQAEAQESVESIQRILFTGACEIHITPAEFNRPGQAIAEVIGGNLSLVVDSMNTSSEPDTNNKILIIEEVDEYFYKVDRMFTQLRRTGKLKNLAGLLIGHMTDIKNSELAFGETVSQIILHAVRDYQYPVAFSFPSGHHNPNLAWIQGGRAVLDVAVSNASLIYPNIYSANE